MIVAVDGPAASGKGALARGVAARFGFPHLDTGLLYRAVARGLLDACGGAQDREAAVRIANGLDVTTLHQRPGLRTPEVDALVSTVAAWPELRDSVIHLQREFAAQPPGGSPGAVLDGRDIGSVVVPDADVKIFVTADLKTRAERRRREMAEQGLPADPVSVLNAIRARDQRDESRPVAPLRRAPGAHLLDTTDLGIGEAVDRVAAIIAEHLK